MPKTKTALRLYRLKVGRQEKVFKMNHIKWSKSEKKIAKEAFEKAYERECSYLAGRIREKANNIRKSDDIWELHDFLTEKRKEVDEKYDYRYSVLDFVFARLTKEGWLEYDLNVLLEGMDKPLPAGEGLTISKGELLSFDTGL